MWNELYGAVIEQICSNQPQDAATIRPEDAHRVLGDGFNALSKIIELISEKQDERRIMRFFGLNMIIQQNQRTQMPAAVEWVIYCMSSFYE